MKLIQIALGAVVFAAALAKGAAPPPPGPAAPVEAKSSAEPASPPAPAPPPAAAPPPAPAAKAAPAPSKPPGSAPAKPDAGPAQEALSPAKGPSGPAYRKGALVGRVVDAATGAPIAGATVAEVASDGKVVAWAKTDAAGDYAIAANPVEALHLGESHHRGLLSRMARGVGAVVAAPVKLVGSATKAAVDTATQTVHAGVSAVAKGAVASAITGSPAPIAAQAVGAAVHAAEGNARQTAVATAQARAEKIVSGERLATPRQARKDPVPGEVRIAVSAANYKDAKGIAGAFWMEPAEGAEVRPDAWLETVRLAPAAGSAKSEIATQALLLADGRLEPDLVPRGGSASVEVKLNAIDGLDSRVRVFAREAKRHTVTELLPAGGGIYRGQLTIDSKEAAGLTTVTIVALHAEPVEVKLPKGKDDPLAAFVEQLDALDPDRPYAFDPRVMASENRIDVPLTVLDPKQGAGGHGG